MPNQSHRDTLFLEEAEILSQDSYPCDQYLLRVQAPQCAARAQPGSFAHIQCAPLQPMRRPLSVMRASPEQGWVEFLYKVVGAGTRLLAARAPGEFISLLGPIGRPFAVHEDRPRPLLIGGGVGMPPMIFLADHLRMQTGFHPLVLLGSEIPFPFRVVPSQFLVPGIPPEVTGSVPLLEDLGTPSRLASLRGYPGCYAGYVTELARHWLGSLEPPGLGEVEVFACGPHPMLAAVAGLAKDFGLPCQVSLEEFMACAVGGCAGCAVPVVTDAGLAMKRVCVDGPVFDANAVYPPAA